MVKRINQYCKYLNNLSELDYIKSKELIANLCEEENHSGFWELFQLFLQQGSSFNDELFEKWLCKSILNILPECNEFLQSIFIGNFEDSLKYGKYYGEEIPFLILSSTHQESFKENIPEEFSKYEFQIGQQQIKGIDLWNLFTKGELTNFINLKIHWLIIFSLFYWYIYKEEEIENIKHKKFLYVFEKFNNLYQNHPILQQQFNQSSIYSLIEYYCFSKRNLKEISSKLNGLEGLFFLKISSQLFSEEFDYSKSIALSLYELEKYQLWYYCILLIYQYYSEEEYYKYFKYYIPITNQLLPEEHFLLSQNHFPKEKYFEIKGDKLYYYSFNATNLKTKIQILFSSIRFYLLCFEGNKIYQILFNEILPLTSILGEYYEKLFEINEELNFYNFNKELKENIQILQIYKKLYYHEKLNLIEHQILIQGLKQSFSTFQVRYDICQLLNKEDFTFEELSHIDAFPKSLLLSIE